MIWAVWLLVCGICASISALLDGNNPRFAYVAGVCFVGVAAIAITDQVTS